MLIELEEAKIKLLPEEIESILNYLKPKEGKIDYLYLNDLIIQYGMNSKDADKDNDEMK